MQDWIFFLQQAQQGDLSAFDRLVQQFRDMAVGYAYSVLGDFQLAEDASQEAFVQAFKDLKTLQTPQAFPSWLRKIIFKYCDRITRKKCVDTIPFETVNTSQELPKIQSDIMHNQEAYDIILRGINLLPENERTVTNLFYINGYSMSEVGEFLEVSVTTIKSRLHSARKKLRKRTVNMVKETLKQHAPDKEFNRKIRRILTQVPMVSFRLHQSRPKDGLKRCPESFPFPSCLRACLEYLEEDFGYQKINVNNKEWRLDTTYVYLMGITGAAFKLSWKPGWHFDNPLLSHLSEDPFEPVARGLDSIGYNYEVIRKGCTDENESHLRKCIVKSIGDAGLPVIANGVVGPPEECLITGFDKGGDIMVGWSFFQNLKDFNADVEFEENGSFRKRNWYKDTQWILILGEKQRSVQLEDVYRRALQQVLSITHTSMVQGRYNGLAAYQAWWEEILKDTEFTGKKVKELLHRYHVHHDAIGTIAEGRWYAFQFLKKIANDIVAPDSLSNAAQCYDDQHSLMWQLWGLVGGPGASAKKAKLFADSDIRKKTAQIIIQARDKQCEAAEYVEKTLKNW